MEAAEAADKAAKDKLAELNADKLIRTATARRMQRKRQWHFTNGHCPLMYQETYILNRPYLVIRYLLFLRTGLLYLIVILEVMLHPRD
ncbi:hypothetical protein [Escherichia coli]|uniref:hypothetical protein n=1 Tax=Escherichia coli TaxID=562 RepID=UPI003EB7797D